MVGTVLAGSVCNGHTILCKKNLKNCISVAAAAVFGSCRNEINVDCNSSSPFLFLPCTFYLVVSLDPTLQYRSPPTYKCLVMR